MSDTRTKITADIVSVKEEDKPLIYISEEAIYLKRNNDKLKSQLQQKESIIKEVREYVEKYEVINGYYDSNYDGENDTYSHDLVKEDIIEILDKVGDEK